MKMKVKTKNFGEIEIDGHQIIDFPEGILGFDFIKKFIIFEKPEENPFQWLMGIDDTNFAFIIIKPEYFIDDIYNLLIRPIDLNMVKTGSIEDLLIYFIVTFNNDNKIMTANLQGPIIINPVMRLGTQAISLDDRYSVRHWINPNSIKRSHRNKHDHMIEDI